jgi:hypothetical protein
MIDFDLNGRKVALDETTVQRLRAKAKAGAGSSSMLNDLAVILGRALSEGKPVTLQRAEAGARAAARSRHAAPSATVRRASLWP